MKQLFHKLAYAILVLLTMSACNDFLDIRPTGKVIPATGAEFRALLTQTYSEVPRDRGLAAFRSDETVLDQGSASAQDLNSYLDIWVWNDDAPQETTTSFGWQRYYHVLYIANYVLAHQYEMESVTENDRRQMVGEAYMLRAYMHFLLVNLYAEPYTHCQPDTTQGIPLKQDCDIDKVLTCNTVAEVYGSILADLKLAEQNLTKEAWETGYTYRFNRLSAEALRARTHLYMGQWSEAYQAACNVLAQRNELEDMTSSATLPNSYLSVEAIVSLEWDLPAQYQTAGRVSPVLLALYKSGDMRKSKYFRQVTASVSTPLKGGSNEFRCTFRTGEFYLIAAEAALESGDTENACRYLTALMRKRYHATMYSRYEAEVLNMDSDQLRREIQNERFRELAYEGHRWFDLRRTTQPALRKTYNGTDYTLEQGDRRYTLRFPSEAIAANPGLVQ